jgi:hypothetical protein
MTIKVVSTSNSQVATENQPDKKDASKSAPEAKEATEQKEGLESETEQTEELGKDESKDESYADEANDESEDSDKEKPKKKGGFQRRIDKLNAAKAESQRERDEAKREAEYWKKQALKDASESKKDPESDSKEKQETSGKPDPDKYETHAEYIEALTDWKIEQRESSSKKEAEKNKLQSEQEKLLKAHSERVKAFSENTEDFEESLESLEGIRSLTVEQIIVESENGPELLYALAKDPAEAKRICALGPIAAAREMGKLEAKISKSSDQQNKPEPKKITKAPQPIAPVGSKGGSSAPKRIDDPNLSQAEYEKLRREQIKARASSW